MASWDTFTSASILVTVNGDLEVLVADEKGIACGICLECRHLGRTDFNTRADKPSN
jgi:hypothetical protein